MNSNENRSEVIESTRNLKNLSVTVRSGSLRKQRLSNNVSLTRTLDGGEFSAILTIREARALRDFLNETLD